MPRALLSRPLVIRQFSYSPSAWNLAQSPPPSSSSSTDTKIKATPPASGSLLRSIEDTQPGQTADGTSNADPPPTAQNNVVMIKGQLRLRLREWTDYAALSFRNQADEFTAATRTTFSRLGSQLNKVTGYEAIEALKRKVVDQEVRINATRQGAREAKIAHDEAVARRSHSQREVNDLLQRKSNWSDGDVGRFTTLVRQDHLFEQEEARAKANVDKTENAVEREFTQLMQMILARYHEEQVWSDKIRSASTYGSLAALGLNMLVFVMAIVVVEPWKRRRLAQTFEKKLEELSLENEARLTTSMKEIGGQLAKQGQLITRVVQEISQDGAGARPLGEIIREAEKVIESHNTERTSSPAYRERNYLELTAVGVSAFAAGVVGFLWLSR